MEFKVKITETFERVVCVEAQDKSEAVVIATNKYLDGKDALNENGLVYFNIKLHEDK